MEDRHKDLEKSPPCRDSHRREEVEPRRRTTNARPDLLPPRHRSHSGTNRNRSGTNMLQTFLLVLFKLFIHRSLLLLAIDICTYYLLLKHAGISWIE
jgi:hypothetical protein